MRPWTKRSTSHESGTELYAWHTKNWMKRYGTGSGSDRVVLGDARSVGARSLPLPVPYRRALPSTPYLGVPLI